MMTNNVETSPVLVFDSPSNPWNLIYIGVYDSKADLEADCGEGASACAGLYGMSIPEDAIKPPELGPGETRVSGIWDGTTFYYWSVQLPDDCHPVFVHEYQHIINKALQPHSSWLEETLVWLFIGDLELCANVQYTDIYKSTDSEIVRLDAPPSDYEINSERPLDSFADNAANKDPCREAIIMQMNRGALSMGQAYLRKLFGLMRTERIQEDDSAARVVLQANDNDPGVEAILTPKNWTTC